MGIKRVKMNKLFNLVYSYISTYFSKTPAFVRVIPTDRCNLNCQYCWQKDNDSYEMKLEEYLDCLKKSKSLNVGLITFLGGEPMLWPHIYKAIKETTEKNILTDLTTNGTLLNEDTINLLGASGLDYLNISVDVKDPNQISQKNSVFKSDTLNALEHAKLKYGMHFRFNSVIAKGNFENTKKIIEFSKENNVQLSLGYIVPPVDNSRVADGTIYFSLEDIDELEEIISYILSKKKEGYPVIDPDSYFKNIFSYLRGENFWNCNYPSRYGWINVTPNGKIRSCTKKMDEIDVDFVDINQEKYKELRDLFKENVKKCNVNCYSNCAYDSYYYTHNKLEMMKKISRRIKWNL